jgi:UDP-N-acetylmuramoylalanine--D-glutamate ligase
MSVKAAVIGFGAEGKSAYRYLTAHGTEVIIHDIRDDLILPEGVRGVLGQDYLEQLDGYDFVVRSSDIKPWLIKTTAKVVTPASIFFEECPARIIGVTGSKGKSTTTALVARILGEAGWRTWVGGDAGRFPLDFLTKVRASHIVVLELSSFDLTDLPASPHIAVSLMIIPEHLDWHRNIREYVAAQGNIFWHQRSEDLAIYNSHNEFSEEIAQLSQGSLLPYLSVPGARMVKTDIVIGDTEVICDSRELGLIGAHNGENVCAAITATWELVKHNTEAVRRAVMSFSGLDGRLEFAGEFAGVHYYDDAYSTTQESTVAALDAFLQPKVLILGGDKGTSNYDTLVQAVVRSNVHQVILTGPASKALQKALEADGFLQTIIGPQTMEDIVVTARSVARKGDIVLLSPACPVGPGFADYRDLGDQFKTIIRGWKK